MKGKGKGKGRGRRREGRGERIETVIIVTEKEEGKEKREGEGELSGFKRPYLIIFFSYLLYLSSFYPLLIEKLKGEAPCLFGVFDGHSGGRASQFAASKLPKAILSHPEYPENMQKVCY